MPGERSNSSPVLSTVAVLARMLVAQLLTPFQWPGNNVPGGCDCLAGKVPSCQLHTHPEQSKEGRTLVPDFQTCCYNMGRACKSFKAVFLQCP